MQIGTFWLSRLRRSRAAKMAVLGQCGKVTELSKRDREAKTIRLDLMSNFFQGAILADLTIGTRD